MRRRELTVGYRVPGPILDYANRLLPVTAPDITPSTSIRSRGVGAEHHVVEVGDLGATVAALASELGGNWSTIGVITMPERMDTVLAGLADAGLDAGDTRRGVELDHAISVVDPPTAKGLEFDATIVVEPGEFVVLPNGLRLLYVALTRSVQRLLIVRSGPHALTALAVDRGDVDQVAVRPCRPAPAAKRVAPSRVSPDRITSRPSSASRSAGSRSRAPTGLRAERRSLRRNVGEGGDLRARLERRVECVPRLDQPVGEPDAQRLVARHARPVRMISSA